MCIDDNEDKQEGHFIHLLLEVYCSYKWNEEECTHVPEFCKKGVKNPGYHCLENECHFTTFTYADNEICYAGESGEVPSDEAWIGFGGDMESQDYNENENKELISKWEDICRKKINEAYEEFMRIKKSK